jgi:16S rRNA (cytosine1402-N4)-methyltransferase
MEQVYHTPVLLKESIEGLNIKPNGVYVDVTFGGGGHSKEILKHLTTGKLIAFDQDGEAAKNVPQDERLIFVPQNFRFVKNWVELHGFQQVDGILADLGVSSHQFDSSERGFSIRFNGPLDMRMNQSSGISADEWINKSSVQEITDALRMYGELDGAYKVATEIDMHKPLGTTQALIDCTQSFAKRGKEKQFLAQMFQAFRMVVNDEIAVLKEFLQQSLELLAPEGRLVVISYHSLEDRLVKDFLRSGNLEGEIKKDFFGNLERQIEPVKSKPILPSQEEIERNGRSRSAKLRVGQKK